MANIKKHVQELTAIIVKDTCRKDHLFPSGRIHTNKVAKCKCHCIERRCIDRSRYMAFTLKRGLDETLSEELLVRILFFVQPSKYTLQTQ